MRRRFDRETARGLCAAALCAALCAGCLSSAPPVAKAWSIETDVQVADAPPVSPESGAAFAVTRVGAVAVNAPYDRTPFAVRRADGSVVFDAYNGFAAAPAALVREPVRTHVAADGRFGRVVPQTSAAAADAAVEVLVTDLSLDCREKGRRTARAAVSVDVVKAGGGGRTVALSGHGAGQADAADGDYSAAFSAAVNAALADALRALK